MPKRGQAPFRQLVERELAGQGVDRLGGKRLEGEAGVGGLPMELGVSGVAHERHRKAELAPARGEVEAFLRRLEARHISATVRREMGADIEGACGQLRRRVLQNRHQE